MEKVTLAPYLPSEDELHVMTENQFKVWVRMASQDIPKRMEERDPLNHLKKRISQIIASDLTEEQKEEQVYEAIRQYQKLQFNGTN